MNGFGMNSNNRNNPYINHNLILLVFELVLFRMVLSCFETVVIYNTVYVITQSALLLCFYFQLNLALREYYQTNIFSGLKIKFRIRDLIILLIVTILLDKHFMGYIMTITNDSFLYGLKVIGNNLFKNLIIGNNWITLIVSSLFEELFYRGLIYRNFRTSLSKNKANLLTSIIFMAFHTTINLNHVIRSMFWGIVYEKTESLILVMILHIFTNILVNSIPKQYFFFGGNILITGLWAIAIVGILIYMCIRRITLQ